MKNPTGFGCHELHEFSLINLNTLLAKCKIVRKPKK